jgi:hypothetical protein
VDKGRAAGRAIVELLEGGHPVPSAFTSELRIGNTTGAAPEWNSRRVTDIPSN